MTRLNRNEREFVEGAPAPAATSTPAPADGRPAASAEARAGAGAQELDARGLGSPIPLLRAHRALRAMPVGQVLRVITSQPQTVAEFDALVKHVSGYELLSQEERDGTWVHLLVRRR